MILALSAPTAGAHPLGNFTVNRYARVEVSGDLVRVYYVLDEAEIPAFQERRELAAGTEAFLEDRVAAITGGLSLSTDGVDLDLRPVESTLDQPEGQGGLTTLRVAIIFTAELPDGPEGAVRTLTFGDENEPDRVGWREIVTVARGDARITATDAPDEDVSDELRDYPGDLLQAPLDQRATTFSFVPGSSNASADPVPESSPPPERSGGLLASLITRQNVGPLVLASLLGIAFAVGAGHALLPGHGKTVMAAYLVGTKGRPIDAVLLGVIVSLMHTASVLVLGLALFRIGRATSLEGYYPALNVVSGILAAALGVWLMVGRWRRFKAWRAIHDHDHHDDELDLATFGRTDPADAHHLGGHETGAHHGHDDHDHDHEPDLVPSAGHEHGHGHGHEHGEHLVSAGVGSAATATTTPVRSRRRRVQHALEGHHHHHGPGGHTHELPEDVAPLTRKGLVLLATSGGVVPSPTAVIVVVSAFSLGRPVLGLGLIAAFSVGLAATLTAVGLALVFGRRAIERRISNRSLELLPTLGAVALIVLGLVLALRGLTGTV